MLVYLSGAMEFAPEVTQTWRRSLGRWLFRYMNHQVYDPTIEAQSVLSAKELEGLNGWKESDPVRFRELMRRIIDRDMDVIENKAHYVICLWDQSATRGGGTQAELTAAYRKGLPVCLVSQVPTKEISGWVLGCVDYVFTDFAKLKDHLKDWRSPRDP